MKFAHSVIESHKVGGGKTLVIYLWDDLSDYTIPKVWENVELFDKDGKKLWTVNGLEKCKQYDCDRDVFVGASPKRGTWQLIAFSGKSFLLDMKTGKVKYFSFYK